MLLLLNEHGNPSFLFWNLLSSYDIINNQLAKFEKNLSEGSISEWNDLILKDLVFTCVLDPPYNDCLPGNY